MADNGLAAGLRVEYESIYAYGVAGAHLSGDRREVAKSNEQAHRDRRDAVVVRLTETGKKIPGAQAAYSLPDGASDADSAAKLVTEVEERTTRQWRSVLAETSGEDRRVAAEAFGGSAVTMARWKRALGESPSTTAFPGRT